MVHISPISPVTHFKGCLRISSANQPGLASLPTISYSLGPLWVFINKKILQVHNPFITRVSLNRGVEGEFSLIWGPVQNQIVQFRGSKSAQHLRHSASLAEAYQENTLDMGLDTLPVFVLFAGRKCVLPKTLSKHPSSWDALTHVPLGKVYFPGH